MIKPRRIQLSRKKGWKKPPNTVIVSRPSRWGNPWHGKTPAERSDAVKQYRQWLTGGWIIDGKKGIDVAIAARRELKGKNLACWCPIDGHACHADILLQLANEGE